MSLRPFIHFILHPLSIGVFLLVLGLLLNRYGQLGLARLLWIGGGLWFFVMLFTPLPHYALRKLENYYPSLDPVPKFSTPPHIVVLASGFTHDTALVAGNQLGGAMLQRLAEGLRLYRQIPGAKLVLSGPAGDRAISQARVAALAAVDLGANYQDIFLLEQPRTTSEEAAHYHARHSEDVPVVLVSSAAHLRRAVHHFRRYGYAVTPAPTAHRLKRELHNPALFRPGFAGIEHARVVIKEYLGYYYARYF